ncbi:hypothetical protein PINS_up001956 [Pythium insidiosum]|nr:hypothetical protein PINS_up001956 [Pythium insidiosum]
MASEEAAMLTEGPAKSIPANANATYGPATGAAVERATMLPASALSLPTSLPPATAHPTEAPEERDLNATTLKRAAPGVDDHCGQRNGNGSHGSTTGQCNDRLRIESTNVTGVPSEPAHEAGDPKAPSDAPAPPVAPPYRSTICRCKPGECQKEIPGDESSMCDPERADGTCREGYKKCVATSSYRVQVVPATPNSISDVSFSLLASDIVGTLYNLGDQNPIVKKKNWWIALRLPADWRFVTWDVTSLEVTMQSETAGKNKTQSFQVRPCRAITTPANCRDDSVGFVNVMDMFREWEPLMTLTSKAPVSFRLEKSVVSGSHGKAKSGDVAVFIVFEKSLDISRRTRELTVSATAADSTSGITGSGELTVIPLATMEVPSIRAGRLYSSLLWVEVDKKKATLSFSTSTIIGKSSLDPQVCVNLRSQACSAHGRLPTSNTTFENGTSAAYVKDGNPFINMYSVPGDAPLTVKPINDTFFCIEKLLPTGVDSNSTWEVNSEFAFQLYVEGVVWSGSTELNKSNRARVPYLVEVTLIDRDIIQGTDCAQLILHDVQYSSHGLSVYSVMSVTIYAVTLVGAILVTRMNGITFSPSSFYNDMTSISVVFILLFSIMANSIWINVSADARQTGASHVYFLLHVITSCFTWTMMTSVCFHWASVLIHDIRKIRRVYLVLAYAIVNGAFYGLAVFSLISLASFYKCAYDDYLKNPKYSKRLCDSDYCPDLQPFQWKYAVNDLCKDVPYSNWFFPLSLGNDILVFISSVALLILGTHVLRRGSRLIEQSGNLIDQNIVTMMRRSLTTYLVVILAITISLAISNAVNLALYFNDWKMNAIVWYTFTIWLPTIIPPAGFLLLQWNPSVHAARRPGTEIEERGGKSEEGDKTALRANSTFGALSDGWAGINDFPDTDYTAIGDEGGASNRSILALSVQLIVPAGIAQACFVEVYVADEEEDGILIDEAGRRSSNARASVSSILESGLLRESVLQRGSRTMSLSAINSSSWARVGSTETVLPGNAMNRTGTPTQAASFMSIIQIPVTPYQQVFRFVVHDIQDGVAVSPQSKDSRGVDCNARISGIGLSPPSKPRVVCEFTCLSTELMNSAELCLIAGDGSYRVVHHEGVEDEYEDLPAPELRVRCNTVATRILKENNDFVISKSFQFGEAGLMVIEDMVETVFTNEIPRQFLDLLIKERSLDIARAQSDLRNFEEKCKNGFPGGTFDNLIDQIQGENSQAVAKSWLEERLRQRSVYVDALKECQQLCFERADEGINFKSSTEKKSLQLRFMPVNLHVQDMWVGRASDLRTHYSRRTHQDVKLYSTVTVGAFAAHCFKFRHSTGVLTLRSKLSKSNTDDQTLRGKPTGEQDWMNMLTRADDEIRWHIVGRMDMCVSQALTALVTSFCRALEAAIQNPAYYPFFEVIEGVGFLWQVESLLSTQGKELGMLEDFYAAVEAMGNVTFVIDTSPPTHLPSTLNLHIKDINIPSVVSARLSGDPQSGAYTVVVGVRCDDHLLAVLPPGIRSGGKVTVTPVMFTQGINEMQTLANSSSGKKTTLQDTINSKSFGVLSEYTKQYLHVASSKNVDLSVDAKEVTSLLAELGEKIESASKQMMKTKHPKIIQLGSKLSRKLMAGRVTSCKSAKDRTGMSVTLEQGTLLSEFHGLPQEFVARTISTMRSNGTRIENAFKNTGKRQYAFNALQRSLLPEEYKCPEGTYGRGNVS